MLGDAALVAEVEEFVARIDGPGRSNSLGQKLLQIAGPGVPDVYQGTELYEYSLVDPDNRRPVDWALRRELLERIDGGWLPDFPDDPEGATKLLVTAQALLLRRQRPELFDRLPADSRRGAGRGARARVRPVGVAGGGGDPAAGRARRGRRLGDTVLPLPHAAPEWTDVLTGTPVERSAPRLERMLARYPVALLVRSG